MEFAVQAWCPHQRGDVATLERVQRRATKVPHGLHMQSYEARLKTMNLLSLEDRRIRGDLIQQYKIATNMEEVNWHFPLTTGPAIGGRRGQIRREVVISCAQRYNFFGNRTANMWNDLPSQVISATSLNSFKAQLDSHYTANEKYKYR